MESLRKFSPKPGVRYEILEVAARLKELELEVGHVTSAVKAGGTACSMLVADHPPLMRGIVGWGETMAVLRMNTAPNGWKRSDADNWPVVVNRAGDIAIAVATGDEATGLRNANPSTKALKGPHTVDAVEVNKNQLCFEFYESGPPADERLEPASDIPRATFFLLIHRTPIEIRFELSLPDNIVDGRINGWLERIIFQPIDLDGGRIDVTPPPQPDLDIAVKRKAA